jgi:hypothetical protein
VIKKTKWHQTVLRVLQSKHHSCSLVRNARESMVIFTELESDRMVSTIGRNVDQKLLVVRFVDLSVQPKAQRESNIPNIQKNLTNTMVYPVRTFFSRKYLLLSYINIYVTRNKNHYQDIEKGDK